jgi:dinuclear metal center YbgI/SA1388 family protein
VASLENVVAYCQERLGLPGFPDYPGAMNGLQMSNRGEVSRIGAAVDAGLEVFRRAAAAQVDFLIVHHGMFWDAPRPWTGTHYDKLALLVCHNIAVYSAHLPLDAHPELGNNARVARHLRLACEGTFLPFEGRDVGQIARCGESRKHLRRKLESLFARVTAIEFGSENPDRVAIVTGAGHGAIEPMVAAGIDTLITGELREHVYARAQESGLNLYACGHCATEVFGVCALAEELARCFSLPWEFIATENPL